MLVGGGVRSGKSAFALERALALGARRVFVATAEARDDEMHVRIERHRAERGDRFATLEAPTELGAVLGALDGVDVVVVDCLTLYLSNLLVRGESEEGIDASVAALLETLRSAPFASVVVTNEVGMGVVPESKLGRVFRDVTGRAHQRFAAQADELYLAALGVVLRLVPAPVEVVSAARS